MACVLIAGSSLVFSSCIGSFGLTHSVLKWNNQVGSKFLNELVFFAFWILPVYEVTALADVLVLNSIEFWSGRNPILASTQTIKTESGDYLIASDSKGYTITEINTGERTRLAFEADTRTWSYVSENGTRYPFLTFVDDDEIRMITPQGDFRAVDLSEQGVMAYQEMAEKYIKNECGTQQIHATAC